jgi:hypothetical protein
MKIVLWALVLAAVATSPTPPAASPPPASAAEVRLADLVARVQSADYRGDRPALAKLDVELGELEGPALSEYREYWRGFALWRRALNGFNETPTPEDLAADLEKAVARFRASLAARPGWIEPRVGMVGCWASLMYLAGKDEARKAAILAEFKGEGQGIKEEGRQNPRALWLVGGSQFWRGDPAGALATWNEGVAAAWAEAETRPVPPPWVPAWGGPENLMNLAYFWSHAASKNRDVAMAYAQGAVTAVPTWHYVRDILIPQIRQLPAASD